ncbi:IS5 family transposase [Methyloterricola oryzae]|uniref:IS5 family transposase n=1 Tax=Methyloterricola oryzae TaxID=1495050 RepID=UPI000A5B75A5|nr:IS5 family transposase [Methyloterricola oryzae]
MAVEFIRLWNNFSDEVAEDVLYDMPVLDRFAGIDVLRGRVPDATTLMNFRHLSEAHHLAPLILDRVNALLEAQGLWLRKGTLVDATLIAATPSTKNQEQQCDPDMHPTMKGNNWRFGMQMQIGVDTASELIHTAVGTAANVSDVVMAGELLHGQEHRVDADAGYTGVSKREEHVDREVDWHVALQRGQVKQLPDDEMSGLGRHIERLKACFRSKVEHPFHTVKNLFGHRKTRYRGLKKNTHQWQVLFALVKVYRVRHQLLAMAAA